MTMIRVVLMGCVLALPGALTWGAEPSSREVTFDIPAQRLSDALNAFGRQAGLSVAFYDDAVADRMTEAVSGKYKAAAALEKLLKNSGLNYRFVNDRTIAIWGQKGADAGGAGKVSQEAAGRNGLKLAQVASTASVSGAAIPGQESTQRDAASSAERSEGGKLEEVVVTATKRKEERLQDVPISIAVVRAEDIDRRGLVSAEDYLRGLPGVNQVSDANSSGIVIRGLETSPSYQNFASGPTVATYFGETPTTNSEGLGAGANVDIKLVDIERVEVLRGPQGTAFGNSSLGGAVRTIPVAPKVDRVEGKVVGNYSVTSGSGSDNHMIQGVGNLPLIEGKLAIRATAYQYEDSGFYSNIAGSDPVFQSATAVFGAQAYAINKDDVGASRFTGGRIAALYKATDALQLTLSYLTQKTEVDGWAQANSGLYQQTQLQIAPQQVRRGETGGFFDTDIDITNAVLEYTLGWGSLLATVSQLNSGSNGAAPSNSALPHSGGSDSTHRERSGEIRLATQLQGAWNFLAGLYAEQLDDKGYFNNYWYGDPLLNPFGSQALTGDYLDRRTLKQKAAFAEIAWEFLPGLTLTGGARAYDYERTTRVVPGGFFGTTPTTVQGDASGSNFRANLSYKVNEGAMVYAGWAQGFRLGKPQPGLPASVCDRDNDGFLDGTRTTIAQTKVVNSDSVDSFEIGSKLTLLDRRLMVSADVYRIKWTGVPVFVVAPTPGCEFSYTANAGEALSQGVELETNFYVTDALRLDLGGSWIDASLTKDAPALNAADGARLPGSPKINANLGLQYEFELLGHKAFVRADSIYVGSFHGDLQESPTTLAGGYVKVDASARVSIRNFNVDLFVRNLTDIDDFTYRGAFPSGQGFVGYRPRPRTVGLQLGYNF